MKSIISRAWGWFLGLFSFDAPALEIDIGDLEPNMPETRVNRCRLQVAGKVQTLRVVQENPKTLWVQMPDLAIKIRKRRCVWIGPLHART